MGCKRDIRAYLQRGLRCPMWQLRESIKTHRPLDRLHVLVDRKPADVEVERDLHFVPELDRLVDGSDMFAMSVAQVTRSS
jgi:hypothetical protein